MRWMACFGLVAAGLCAGCASERGVEPIAFAVMQENEPAPAKTAAAIAFVERRVIDHQTTLAFRHPTLLRVRGQQRDFRVLTGPLQVPALAGEAAAQAAEVEQESVGTFHNPDGSWEVNQGYALLWGWWPTALTERVTFGVEGSTILVIAERTISSNRDYLVFVSGNTAEVRRRDSNQLLVQMGKDKQGFFVVATGSGATLSVSTPAKVDDLPADHPVRVLLEHATTLQTDLMNKRRSVLLEW